MKQGRNIAPYNGNITQTGVGKLPIFESMKMKLAQRFLLGYYTTKLKTIGLISPRKAAEAAFQLFCTPYGGRPKTKEPPVFHKAEKLFFQLNGLTIGGFRWVHDRHDPICTFDDVKPLLSLDLPGTRFLITENLGHSKVDKNNQISREIVQFFARQDS